MAAETPNYSLYDSVGGAPTFKRLVEAFYRRVEADALLRPMYPNNLWGRRHSGPGAAGEEFSFCSPVETLAAFLAQFFGGPPVYSENRGHPRLRMRHARFKIGQAERDAWLTHMCAAIDEVDIGEPAASLMRQYFSDASTFLINQPVAP